MRFRWNGQEFPWPEKMTFAELTAVERHLGVEMDEWSKLHKTLAPLWAGACRHALATGQPVPTWDDIVNSSPEDDGFDVIADDEDAAPAADAGPPALSGSPAGTPEAAASSATAATPTSSS